MTPDRIVFLVIGLAFLLIGWLWRRSEELGP